MDDEYMVVMSKNAQLRTTIDVFEHFDKKKFLEFLMTLYGTFGAYCIFGTLLDTTLQV